MVENTMLQEIDDATVLKADGRLLIRFDGIDSVIDVASIESLSQRFEGDLSDRLREEL